MEWRLLHILHHCHLCCSRVPCAFHSWFDIFFLNFYLGSISLQMEYQDLNQSCCSPVLFPLPQHGMEILPQSDFDVWMLFHHEVDVNPMTSYEISQE